MKQKLTYENLLIIVRKTCNKFYNSDRKMFGSNIRSRDEEKDVIYSSCRFALAGSDKIEYDSAELQKAVDVCVDEISIERYSSAPPKNNTD